MEAPLRAGLWLFENRPWVVEVVWWSIERELEGVDEVMDLWERGVPELVDQDATSDVQPNSDFSLYRDTECYL
jgi:hypothetical protein